MAKTLESSNPAKARRFKGPGVEVVLTEGRFANGRQHASLAILEDGEPWAPPLDVIVLEANGLKLYLKPCIIHFPGKTRHPAGEESAHSWFNDHGEGWLRIRTKEQHIIFPLTGPVIDAEASAIPSRGLRGPPRSLDLWLAASALLRLRSITSESLHSDTGFNAFNIHRWLTQSAERGHLEKSTKSPLLRFKRYKVPPEQVYNLAEQIRVFWGAWRQGDTLPRLKPLRRYFVANCDWSSLKKHSGPEVYATGISWFEGNDGGRTLLTPSGSIPQLSFICRASQWKMIQSDLAITSREERKRPYDSEVTILQDDHPILRMITHREAACGNPDSQEHLWMIGLKIPPAEMAWPSGFRALDAMDDPAPRVREAAERSWKYWVQSTAGAAFGLEAKADH